MKYVHYLLLGVVCACVYMYRTNKRNFLSRTHSVNTKWRKFVAVLVMRQ